MNAYNTNTADFAADLAACLAAYDATGRVDAASDACAEIADRRGLNAGERLTLATAICRNLVYRD